MNIDVCTPNQMFFYLILILMNLKRHHNQALMDPCSKKLRTQSYAYLLISKSTFVNGAYSWINVVRITASIGLLLYSSVLPLKIPDPCPPRPYIKTSPALPCLSTSYIPLLTYYSQHILGSGAVALLKFCNFDHMTKLMTYHHWDFYGSLAIVN